ncbi:hypothetical protein ES703_73865 [subsurface metagenome]
MLGQRRRKEPSLSSASATRKSLFPNLALEPPHMFNLPPITTVGSRPPCVRIEAIILVVVVFPCAPATAIPYFSLISSASISARGITGMDCSLASTNSGLSSFTAEEKTTTSAAPTFSGLCPRNIWPPRSERCSVTSVLLVSEPLIW